MISPLAQLILDMVRMCAYSKATAEVASFGQTVLVRTQNQDARRMFLQRMSVGALIAEWRRYERTTEDRTADAILV